MVLPARICGAEDREDKVYFLKLRRALQLVARQLRREGTVGPRPLQ
jgi:hypothetical protein